MACHIFRHEILNFHKHLSHKIHITFIYHISHKFNKQLLSVRPDLLQRKRKQENNDNCKSVCVTHKPNNILFSKVSSWKSFKNIFIEKLFIAWFPYLRLNRACLSVLKSCLFPVSITHIILIYIDTIFN